MGTLFHREVGPRRLLITNRHCALSFNRNSAFTDIECNDLYHPCAQNLWESDQTLEDVNPPRSKGVRALVQSLDVFHLLIPFGLYVLQRQR